MKTTTSKPRKPRPRPERTLQLYPGSPALLEMSIGSESFSYWLTPLGSELGGLAFELKKPLPDGTVYHVRLDGKHSTCDCPGFERWGMSADGGRGCKHIAALAELVVQGKLAGLPCKAPEPVEAACPVELAPCTDFDDF